MANWNLISKLMSTFGTTAFGVGFTGMAIKGIKEGGCHNNFSSIFGGGFGYPANFNTFNYDITNPYAFLNSNITPTNSVKRTSSTGNVKRAQSPPPDKMTTLQTNVGKAQEFLQEHLKTLSDTDLEKLGISSAKRDKLLNYIANIKYEDDPLHDTMHGGNKNDDYAITVNTKLQDSDNLANMVTMLVHEANHCDEAYLKDNPNESEIGDTRHRDASGNPINAPSTNTKWEERACETLGVMTCAVLIDKGELPNYSRYNNHQFTEYLTNPDLLNKDIDEWCNKGYTNYIEDFDGNVTFEHMRMDDVDVSGVPDTKIQIQKGDIVKVNGKKYTIGNGIFMESSDSAPIIQLCDYINLDKKNSPTMLTDGRIIFDKLEPTQSEKEKVGLGDISSTAQTVEVIRNGKVIYTGKVYK